MSAEQDRESKFQADSFESLLPHTSDPDSMTMSRLVREKKKRHVAAALATASATSSATQKKSLPNSRKDDHGNGEEPIIEYDLDDYRLSSVR
jgi:hypothetical protein